jgi:hypothetical protein
MSFKQFLKEQQLQELFNTPYDWGWTKDTGQNWVAEFRTEDDHTYYVRFYASPENVEDAFFYITNENLQQKFTQCLALGTGWAVTFVDAALSNNIDKAYGILGDRNSLRVFATVIEVIKDFTRQTKHGVLSFTAHEPNRQKLYQSMIDKLTKGPTATVPSAMGKQYLVGY